MKRTQKEGTGTIITFLDNGKREKWESMRVSPSAAWDDWGDPPNVGSERERLVGFLLLRSVCNKRGRRPTCCHHDDNPGKLGNLGGGACAKRVCPVWLDIEESNKQMSGGRS